jgi:hypothetical protein
MAGRITLDMSNIDMLMAMSEENPGALTVLLKLLNGEDGFFKILLLDSKKLYGSDIWVLYKDICGENLNRFIYHIDMELPDQDTGELGIMGPYSIDTDKEFWDLREFGKPKSFWALENPPTNAYYTFPITNEMVKSKEYGGVNEHV